MSTADRWELITSDCAISDVELLKFAVEQTGSRNLCVSCRVVHEARLLPETLTSRLQIGINKFFITISSSFIDFCYRLLPWFFGAVCVPPFLQ